jgi:hypothetical protein
MEQGCQSLNHTITKEKSMFIAALNMMREKFVAVMQSGFNWTIQ